MQTEASKRHPGRHILLEQPPVYNKWPQVIIELADVTLCDASLAMAVNALFDDLRQQENKIKNLSRSKKFAETVSAVLSAMAVKCLAIMVPTATRITSKGRMIRVWLAVM